MSKTPNKFSPDEGERAGRVVLDGAGPLGSRWREVTSIAARIGCFADTLNDWVKKAEVDSGRRAGIPSDMAERMKSLERENRVPAPNMLWGRPCRRHWSEPMDDDFT
ncbi:hypothetical protein [Salipiger mangrovisoli]|uniref:Transposase n=1 Tax=Salipiger mangrovisoli TaxID=2865933 RepID=A0ABR9X5G2_9RHOB|nr:hypothetical protein [Salipiger mangrovisoli]